MSAWTKILSPIILRMNFNNERKEHNILRPQGYMLDGHEDSRGILHSLAREDILTDCLVTFLLSAGICLALLPLTVIQTESSHLLQTVAVCTAVFALLRIRWWIAPLLFLLTLGGAGIHFNRSGGFEDTIEHWTEFAIWAFWYGAYDHEVFSEGIELVLLRYLAIALVTLTIFLMMRRMFSIWLAIASFIGVMIAAELHEPAEVAASLALFMAGVVILIPRIYSRYINKRSEIKGSRSFMQMIAVPCAALALTLSLIITPQSGEYMQWRRMANLFNDVGYFMGTPLRESQDVSSNFGLGALGFEPLTDRLGGPVFLPYWHMLTVISDTPVLLRGAVSDYYTGYSWRLSQDDSSLRFDSFLWRSDLTEAFGLDMPISDLVGENLLYSLTTDITLSVIYEIGYYTTLFAPLGVNDVSFFTSSFDREIFFNARGEIYTPFAIPQGETLVVQARVFDFNAPNFEENFQILEARSGPDPRFYDIHARHTSLPENLPDSVRQAAFDAVAGETSPFMQATAISRWLGENFHYTLSPVVPPEDVDFVEHFLLTREGYCTYYATAMAIMARAVGLPSRYVTGFALERDFSYENVFYATGMTAHAWTEIYFYGIGWVTFDPLIWNADAPLNADLGWGAAMPTHGPLLDEEYDWGGILDTLTLQGQGDTFDPWPYIRATAIALILGSVAYLAFAWNSKYRRYSPERVARKIPDNTGRFCFYYTDIMKQLKLLDLDIHPGETLINYPNRIEIQIEGEGIKGENTANFAIITGAQMRLHFANIPPLESDVEAAGKLHKTLEDKLRKKFSPFTYIMRRR